MKNSIRTCSCLGNNPDCYKCGGWGILGNNVGKHRGDPEEQAEGSVQHEKLRLVKMAGTANLRTCPKCGGEFTDWILHINSSQHQEALKMEQAA